MSEEDPVAEQRENYEFIRDLVAKRIGEAISEGCETLEHFGLAHDIACIERDVLMESVIHAIQPMSAEEVFDEAGDFIATLVGGLNERFNMNIKVTLGLNEAEDSEGDLPVE